MKTHLRHSAIILLVAFGTCLPQVTHAESDEPGSSAPTGPSIQTGPIKTATLERPQERPAPKTQNLPRLRFETEGRKPTDVADEILAAMTLDEKISQMCQIFPGGEVLSEDLAVQIRTGQIGSIFYTGNPELVRRAQEVAVEESRLGIPLIVARDVIHGLRTVFPIPLGQAASWNPELVREGAACAADESRSVGIHWTFAPMVDISRDPRWGRIAECLGEDPFLASELGAAMVHGFQEPDTNGRFHGVAACGKHFVGYGLSEGGRDYNRAMVSRNELRNAFLPAFKACVEANAQTMMTAFNSVNGVPASAHQYLVRDVLKDEWNFPGFIVSDWASIAELIVHGYVADEKDAARAALRSGLDMEMVSTCFREHLPDLVANSTISEELIDDAVKRILLTKIKLGLFKEPYADEERLGLLAQEHRDKAQKMARQSIVMLKNDGVLPLKKKEIHKVAVIGPLADAGKDQLGCWVLDGKAEDTITPLAALKKFFGPDVDITHVPCLDSKYHRNLQQFETAVAAAKHADIVLAFVGEEEALSGEAHSRTDINLPGSQAALIEKLKDLEVPTVMIVIAGRPLTMGQQVEQTDAVLYAWHPGTMGGPAIVDILFGKESPSGKLPVTFPKVVGQIPLYYNHLNTGRPTHPGYNSPPLKMVKSLPEDVRYASHYVDSDPFPLFPFGFGLSYAEFEYSDLALSSRSISTDGSLDVSVRLKNVGKHTGIETVQLYVRDKVASVLRPVKELKGFRRVELEPGESTFVTFELSAESLGYYNEEEEFMIEPGKFKLWIGGDSQATLSEKFVVE